MSQGENYLEFAPPASPGLVRAVALALLAHGFLAAGLAIGVNWKRESTPVTAEAELWAAIPQEAAPPPAPPPEPEPEPERQPPPAPEVAKPILPDPSIAIEREKLRLKKEREADRLALEKAKEKERAQLEKKQKLKEKALADKLAKDKALAEQKLKERAKPPVDPVDAKKLAALRDQNLKRMAGLAAGTGSATSAGTAAQSAGPSAGYAGRIRARIKPNITYTDTITGNPMAEVEVRTSPDGTIISRKLTQSSGVKSWDDAVLNAIDKTEVLPRDVDGRVPSALVISFRPRD